MIEPASKLTAEQKQQIDDYVRLLMGANSAFNLTAMKDRDQIRSNLVATSIELARLVPDGARSLIDVGTGGGVPGMIVAIVRPEVAVCLLDATAKKVRFLEQTASELGLKNVQSIHGRAEEVSRDPGHRERYEIGTARAVARLATLVELVLPFVAPGGLAIFPKGEAATTELEEARQAIGFVGGASPRVVPSNLDETRYILIDKRKTTPERFPRRTGLPAKRPIGVPVG